MISYKEIALNDERNTYIISFSFSLIMMILILFYSPSVEVVDNPEFDQNIQIINIDKIAAPKRLVKREISTEEGTPTDEKIVERAKGTSLEESAVDIAFFPSIAPPRPVGKLKRYYPKSAREKNIEAVVNVSLLINVDGKIISVKIIRVRLSKNLPPEISSNLIKAFSRDAKKILLGEQFTPAIVQGKRVPIKMILPLNFKLEN